MKPRYTKTLGTADSGAELGNVLDLRSVDQVAEIK